MKNNYLTILAFLVLSLKLSAQEFNWAHAYDIEAMAVSVNKIKSSPDRQGGLVMAMNYQGSINPDPNQPNTFHSPPNNYGVVITRVDANGDMVFAHYLDISYYDHYRVHDVQSKSDGTFYVIATSRLATYPFNVDPTGGSSLISNYGLIISTYDIDGTFIGGKRLAVDGFKFNYFEGAISENDELVINGSIEYSAQFSETTGEGVSNGPGRRGFTVKYDENLNYVWGDFFANEAPTPYSTFNYGNLAIAPNGKIYSSMAFGATVNLANGSTYTADNVYDVLIIEYDGQGNITNDFLYTSSRESDYIQSIAVSDNNTIAVIGYAHQVTDLDVKGTYTGNSITSFGSFYLALYDESFNLLTFKSKNMGNTRPKSCRFNAAGELVIAGRLFNTFDFDFETGGNEFYSLPANNYDVFLAKYDAQLDVIYAKSAGNSTNYGDIEKLHIDQFDNIFMAGEFGTSAVDVNFGPLTNEVVGSNSPYGFIAKYSMCEQYIGTETIGVCPGDSYTFSDGYTANNIQSTVSRTIYNTKISSCDSIVTVIVNPNPVYNLQEDVSVCDGNNYTFPDGTTLNNIQANTSHISNLTTVLGCDSIITTSIAVKPVYSLQESITVCSGESYTFPDGTTQSNITSPLSYVSSLNSIAFCDSVITTNVSVTDINSTVIQNGNTLEVAQSNAVYQWFDCGDNSLVANGNNQSVTVNNSGDYQVEIQYNGCTVTSDCESVQIASVSENDFVNLKAYPNPANEFINVAFTEGIDVIEIYALDGKLLLSQVGNHQTEVSVGISQLTTGNYLMVIHVDGNSTTKRIVKN